MIPAVSGNGGYGKGKGFVSADELRSQLLHLRFEKALIVKLVITSNNHMRIIINVKPVSYCLNFVECQALTPYTRIIASF